MRRHDRRRGSVDGWMVAAIAACALAAALLAGSLAVPAAIGAAPAARAATQPATSPATAPATAPALPRFGAPPEVVVGVFQPQAGDFPRWLAMGCNAVVLPPINHDPYGWSYQSVLRRLWQVRASVEDYADPKAFGRDAGGTPNALAWVSRVEADEPDLKLPADPDARALQIQAMAAEYALVKAADPKRLVYLTLAGGDVLGWQRGASRDDLRALAACADVVGVDLYPVTGWGLPDKLGAVGDAIDAVRTLAPGKVYAAYVETSNQRLAWVANPRGVTPEEARAIEAVALVHGAKWLVLFPESFADEQGNRGFLFDATPPDVAAALTVLHGQVLGEWAPYLGHGQWQRVQTGNDAVRAAAWLLNGKRLEVAVNWSHQPQLAGGSTYLPLEVRAAVVAAAPVADQLRVLQQQQQQDHDDLQRVKKQLGIH